MGRVRQVGPPEPLIPISCAGYRAPHTRPPAARASSPGCRRRRRRPPGRDRRGRWQPRVGNSGSGTLISRIPRSPSSSQSPAGKQRKVDDRRRSSRDGRDHDRSMEQLRGVLARRERRRPETFAADQAAELALSASFPSRRVLRHDAEEVRRSQKLSAAVDRAGRAESRQRGIPRGARPAPSSPSSRDGSGLPERQRDRAPIGDQERIERVGEVRVRRVRTEVMDDHAQPAQNVRERVVLRLALARVLHRVEKPVRRACRRRDRTRCALGGRRSCD